MHRWIWDLRYGRGAEMGDDSDDGDGPPPPGPLVLPGTYRVKLSVDGKEWVQPLSVRMDPRSLATPAELNQQFQWALKVYSTLAEADKAIGALSAAQSRSPSVQEYKKLTRSLNALLGALENADRMPPEQVISAYRETAKKLDLRFKEILKSDR
jgi:hypothetical protein